MSYPLIVSYLYIEFTTSKTDGTPFLQDDAFFAYNCLPHLFSEMRYELNGFEIDRCKVPGITSTLKNMIAYKSEDERPYLLFNQNSTTAINAATYKMVLPLRFVFGFCDDFRKVILNSKHERCEAVRMLICIKVTSIIWSWISIKFIGKFNMSN